MNIITSRCLRPEEVDALICAMREMEDIWGESCDVLNGVMRTLTALRPGELIRIQRINPNQEPDRDGDDDG